MKPSARFTIPKPMALQFIGRMMQLEQRNQAMNYFIGVLVEKMREAGIYTVLVKGQGVGQCYERPLWRSCGDVDFFLDDENYGRAKGLLRPLAASVEEECVRENAPGDDHRPVGDGTAREAVQRSVGEDRAGAGCGATGDIRGQEGAHLEGRRDGGAAAGGGERCVLCVHAYPAAFLQRGHRPAADLRLVLAAVDVSLGD